MSCAEFDRWLDQGQPRESLEAMSAHAAGCARCMRALAAALELDALLSSTGDASHPAPEAFADRVMARVRVTPQDVPIAPRAVLGLRSGPLWLRTLSDPAVALALVVAALMAWRGPMLLAAGPAAAATLLGPMAALFNSPRLVPAGLPQGAWFGVMIATLPPLAWLGWRLYRATERVAARVARRA